MIKRFDFHKFVVFFAAVLLCLSSVSAVRACTCFSPSLEGAVEGAGNIVIAKMQSVVKLPKDVPVNEIDTDIKQTNFTVTEVFKGKLKPGQEIRFEQGVCCNCVLAFDEKLIGREFLFYLAEAPNEQNLWTAYVCSRSNTLLGAAGDLKYLEKMAKVRGKTRLAGTLRQEDESAIEGEEETLKFLAGKTVVITGRGKTVRLKTDENGVYEIYDLPPGKYRVTPEKVSGYRWNDDGKLSEEVEIEAKSLTEADFKFTIDNSISGRIFDTDGKALGGVRLSLLPARGKAAEYFSEVDYTDEKGFFKFEEIPAGTYVIVINEKNEVTADSPFGTFYYPNKVNRAEAAEITIGPGNHFKEFTVTAPTTAETVTISGVLLFEDGTPTVDEFVRFYKNIETPRQLEKFKYADSQAKTDRNGRFSIKILKGEQGILFGSIITYVGEYESCPKLDALIRAKGKSVQMIETPAMQIKAENDLTGIEFKFPFPACKKAKRE